VEFDVFPEALSGEELQEILRSYLSNESAFLLPGTDKVVVQYLIPPGTRPGDIEDFALTPMVAVADIVPGWDLVGFADGHAKAYPTGAPPDAWRQYILPPKE